MTNFFERIMLIAENQGYRNPNDFAKNGLGWASPEKINRLKGGDKMPVWNSYLKFQTSLKK